MGVVGDPFSYMVASKEETLADKHLALVGRARRIKNRDLFDLMWLHHQGVAFRPDMLHAKLDAKSRTSFVGLLRQRAKDAEDAISSRAYEPRCARSCQGDQLGCSMTRADETAWRKGCGLW